MGRINLVFSCKDEDVYMLETVNKVKNQRFWRESKTQLWFCFYCANTYFETEWKSAPAALLLYLEFFVL